jgi:hypothetical protein
MDRQVQEGDKFDASSAHLDPRHVGSALNGHLAPLQDRPAGLVQELVGVESAIRRGGTLDASRPGAVLSSRRRQIAGVVPQGNLDDEHQQQEKRREDQNGLEG